MGTGSVENSDVCSVILPLDGPRTSAYTLWTESSGSEDNARSERKGVFFQLCKRKN